ncbi:hypothetical protein FBZ90_10221 [Nitrospirillum pindoramense]|uniref:Uncharacterized protein n=1 Tax=Nitrospirillum amazonense TaxID=28077 RepID=A0A560HGF6_9PROT|nr:hypothetical protein FBZ90_10221 [Nitrospirillum amazonense]
MTLIIFAAGVRADNDGSMRMPVRFFTKITG